jgi:hypothetical protein
MQHIKKAKLKVTCCYLQKQVNNYFANNKNQAFCARNTDAEVAHTIQHKNINSAGVFSLICELRQSPVFQMQKLEEKTHFIFR